ncbi:MAG: hypothetical protein ACYTFG_21915 [Planctomycetota bacterium]
MATQEEPLLVSRSERSILTDMANLPDGDFAAEEARGLLSELVEDLHEVTPLVRVMLEKETRVDLDMWDRRIKALLQRGKNPEEEDQEDLFSPPG